MLNYSKLLPNIIRKIISRQDFCLDKIPYSTSIDAGVLFTDVKGFTKLTEKISQAGHYSIERITDMLNTYFDEMYRVLEANGGDLIKFGGDSILALFPGDQDIASKRILISLSQMNKALEILNKKFMNIYKFQIAFHGNWSWGKVNINIVGDIKHHLDYYISGKALEDIFIQGDKNLEVGNLSELPLITSQDYLTTSECSSYFLPKKVSYWLSSGKFSGELKNSAVIFIQLESTLLEKKEIDIIHYQDFYSKLQSIVYFYDGTINKIDYTDKGYLILITFGVPFIHKDDIERAFATCLKVSKLETPAIKTKIGLTYNNIYSGLLGAIDRYEYGIIGNGVNIAARLMSKSQDNDFAFSSEILPFIKGRYQTQFIDKVNVKGISKDIEIYHVSNEFSDYWTAYVDKFKNSKLIAYNDILADMDNKKLNLIYGKSGSGKSHLIYEYLKNKNDNQHVKILVLSEYDKLKSFTLFYNIFNAYAKLDNILTDLSHIEDFLKNKQINLDLTLIEEFFNESDSEIKQKELPLLLDLLSEILILLLEEYQILILENLQWLDFESTKLLEILIPKLLSKNIRLSITSSSLDSFLSYGLYSQDIIKMKDFDEDLLRDFVSFHKLSITPAALKEILKLANNNPAYIKEICSLIKENLTDNYSTFDLNDFKQLVRKGKLPNTFETLLLNEFESLDAQTKQVLKYASIMGVSFNNQVLNIFSEDFVQIQIEKVLENLTQNQQLFKKIILPEIEYYFNNSLMRDAIYRTILFTEKRKLHKTIANYYLQEFKDNLLPFYEVIANHFISAQIPAQACKWSLLAADKNQKQASYSICSYYYVKALSFATDDFTKNQIKLKLVNSFLEQNKAPQVTQYLDLINIDFLNDQEKDLYYLAKFRLLDIQKDYKNLVLLHEDIKKQINSTEIKQRIDLIMLDYFRMTNARNKFFNLKNKLENEISKQSPLLQIIYYSILGQDSLDRAEYDIANASYQKLGKLASQNNKKIFLRISKTSLGIIEIRRGNQDHALKYFTEALAIAENIGDKHGFAKVNTEIAMILFSQGKDQEAIDSLDKCLLMAKYIGDKQQEQTVLYNFGYVHSILQNFDLAIKYLQEAKSIAQLINDKIGITYANDGLGDAFFNKQDFKQAKIYYESNLELQKELQDKEGIAHTIGNLANILREEKNYPKALEFYQIQHHSLQEIGDKIGQGKALFNWGITFEILANDQKAIEKLEEAYLLFKDAGDVNYSDFTQQQIDRIKKKSKNNN